MPANALSDGLSIAACRAYFSLPADPLRGARGRISEETMQRYDTPPGAPAIKSPQQIPRSIRGTSAPATAVQREARASRQAVTRPIAPTPPIAPIFPLTSKPLISNL